MKRTMVWAATATLITALAAPASAGGKNGPRKAKVLAKYDANRNGVLDPTEKAQLRADRQARRAQKLKQYDANRDGVLQPAERAAWRRDRAGARFDKMVARADTNGDKALSAAELQAAARARAKRRAGNMARRLARADANRDGVITRAEFQQAAATAKRHRRAKKPRPATPTP